MIFALKVGWERSPTTSSIASCAKVASPSRCLVNEKDFPQELSRTVSWFWVLFGRQIDQLDLRRKIRPL